MKTKEEVIKEAWGLVLPFEPKGGYNLNDGFSNKLYMEIDVNYSFFEYEQVTINMGIIRPKSLQGIENNNGWISVNESLPNESGYYVMYNSENRMLLIELNSTTDFKSLKQQFLKDGFTHYQPIIKPNKPLY